MTAKDILSEAQKSSMLSSLSQRFGQLIVGFQANGDALSEQEIARLRKKMTDYAGDGLQNIAQRQWIYVGTCLLMAFYYTPQVAVMSFLLFQAAELIECWCSKRVVDAGDMDSKTAVKLQRVLLISALVSSAFVGFIAYSLARLEGPTTHFTPLIFLFTGALFAAVNNRQMPNILLVRLINYGIAFLLIPILDLWAVKPSLDSVLWLQLASVLFALYFVVDYSMVYLALYRRNLDQLEDLRLERDKAKVACEVKSQFVSVVSHELRTPLTSILGALNLLSEGVFDDQPEQANKVLQIANNNSKHLANLINDLLDLQKIDSGQMDYKFVQHNMPTIVKKAVESISGIADSANIKIRLTEIDQQLKAPVDHDRILQVLANLLSNAIKFSKPGGVVEVSLVKTEDHARILVRDKGIGIPENSHDLVFGKFRQVDSSDHRVFRGSGLGMSITKQIVEDHGGTIDFVSQLGVGTTFTVELPLMRGIA